MFRIKFFIKQLIVIFIVLPLLCLLAILSRFKTREFDVGMGPIPLINNIYHKMALQLYGYKSETFVNSVYFITSEFDYRGDLLSIKSRFLLDLWLFSRALFKYNCLYIYFNGGPLGAYPVLRKLEPLLLKLALIKVVVMPYGADVYDIRYCANLPLKHAMSADYPEFHQKYELIEKQIRRWTKSSDFVLSGCDWVDYNYHWDRLMLAHFSIDLKRFNNLRTSFEYIEKRVFSSEKPLRILHAPNHKTIKGTSFLIKAVNELQKAGYPIQLNLMEKRPNNEILEEIGKSDVVADQLVIGWYAMFALESMALNKPVICYLRQDLIDLYYSADILKDKDELPFINARFDTIKEVLKDIVEGKVNLNEHGERGLAFTKKYHSIESVGKVFDEVNIKLGINKI
ncbi:MAG: hypothetical protein O2887_03830 [Bacteroidetes bacterium]|nr:hypothetical protein [Bacteroidota bacterium]MDA1119616.1 hypothetical protein [Bacteroidota bacterium]